MLEEQNLAGNLAAVLMQPIPFVPLEPWAPIVQQAQTEDLLLTENIKRKYVWLQKLNTFT
jgi:hypothetical protein